MLNDQQLNTLQRVRELETNISRGFTAGDLESVTGLVGALRATAMKEFFSAASHLERVAKALCTGDDPAATVAFEEIVDKLSHALQTDLDVRYWSPGDELDALVDYLTSSNPLPGTSRFGESAARALALYRPALASCSQAADAIIGERPGIGMMDEDQFVSAAELCATLHERLTEEAKQGFIALLSESPAALGRRLITLCSESELRSLDLPASSDLQESPSAYRAIVRMDELRGRLDPCAASTLPSLRAIAHEHHHYSAEGLFLNHLIGHPRFAALRAEQGEALQSHVRELIRCASKGNHRFIVAQATMLIEPAEEAATALLNYARGLFLKSAPGSTGGAGNPLPLIEPYRIAQLVRPIVTGMISAADFEALEGESAVLARTERAIPPAPERVIPLLIAVQGRAMFDWDADGTISWGDVLGLFDNGATLTIRPRRQDVSEPEGAQSVLYAALQGLAERDGEQFLNHQRTVLELLERGCLLVARNTWSDFNTGEFVCDQGASSPEGDEWRRSGTIGGERRMLRVDEEFDPVAHERLIEKYRGAVRGA